MLLSDMSSMAQGFVCVKPTVVGRDRLKAGAYKDPVASVGQS
jgi:hypothetical protein